MVDNGVQINDAFFEEIGKSAPVVKLLTEKADAAAAAMRSDAPSDTGAYKRGFKVKTRQSRYRTVVIVENEDPKTLLIEAKKGIMVRALKRTGKTS
jgi:hypothetical protein